VTSSVLRAVRAALDAADAPRRGERVLVAVSGGPDSTALLDALATLAPAHGVALVAGHVDHALRGTESAADTDAVRALASRLGIACTIVRGVVAPGANLEARAREIRHRALRRVAREVGASCVAFAHTQDDQVETLLMRLVRGSGRRGLGAMAPRRGRVWRPLLGATRADVRRHLALAALPYRLDRTNADLRHTRNRLRRLVVPLLVRELNPRLGPALAALAARLRDEDAYLAAAAASRLDTHRRGSALATAVAAEPPAIARRLVRTWLDEVAAGDVSAEQVERVLALAAGARHGDVGVRGPGRIVRDGDRLVHRAGRRAVAAQVHHEVETGCTVDGPRGAWRLTISTPRARREDELTGLSPGRARFDADRLALPLVVRSVRPGDRIGVPGVGTRKLQDVFVDAKIPRERRSTVPIVVDATGTVLWVAGVVRGGAARVETATAHVVEMELAPLTDDRPEAAPRSGTRRRSSRDRPG
jgi:tRNA(Ile)-lysidine synthase